MGGGAPCSAPMDRALGVLSRDLDPAAPMLRLLPWCPLRLPLSEADDSGLVNPCTALDCRCAAARMTVSSFSNMRTFGAATRALAAARRLRAAAAWSCAMRFMAVKRDRNAAVAVSAPAFPSLLPCRALTMLLTPLAAAACSSPDTARSCSAASTPPTCSRTPASARSLKVTRERCRLGGGLGT